MGNQRFLASWKPSEERISGGNGNLSIAGMLYEKTDNWCVWPHGGHGSSQSGCHGVEGRKPDSGGLE